MATGQRTGCSLCGAPLTYLDAAHPRACASCGLERLADAHCEQGHFVCDACHTGDAAAAIEHVCRHTREPDMLALLSQLRALPGVAIHGPEHHAIVAAVVLTTYRNLGGEIGENDLAAVVRRGLQVPGGFCGRAGMCGAAAGVGVAFATLIRSTPVKARERQLSMQVTQRVLGALSEVPAARCCQRDSFLALREAAALSRELLPIALHAEAHWPCQQVERNKQCLGAQCPLHPTP